MSSYEDPAENVADPDDPAPALARSLGELHSYFDYYVAVQADQFRRRARRWILWLMFAGVLALIAAAILMTAAVMLVIGLAGALAEWLNCPLWLGYMLSGGGVFALAGLGAAAALRVATSRMRKMTESRLAALRAEQRRRFGHDIQERSQEIN